MNTREWKCLILCLKEKGVAPIPVVVNIEDLNEYFVKHSKLLIAKESSCLYGLAYLQQIFDMEGDQKLIHYSRNNPNHMSREISDLVRELVKPIYVI